MLFRSFAFYIFIQQIYVLNILNMCTLSVFSSSKCRLFHNATFFGFSIIHILNTGVLKLKIKFRRLKVNCVLNQYININIIASLCLKQGVLIFVQKLFPAAEPSSVEMY